MKVHFISLFTACCLGLIPVSAQAQNVSVLGIITQDGDDNLADDLSVALRNAVRETPGWVLIGGDVTAAQMMLAANCDPGLTVPDALCFHQIATMRDLPTHPILLVYGTLSRRGEGESMRMVLDLQLFDLRPDRITSELSVEMTVLQIMTLSERNRLAREWIGQLVMNQSVYEGEPSVATPHPAASFDLEYVAWPLIGLAVVSLGVEIGAWAGLNDLNNNPDFTAYRSGFGTGTGNVCAQPSSGSPIDERGHSLCSQGDTLEVLEWVFLAVGLGSAAGGITLLLLDLTGGHPSAAEHSLLIRPSVSSTHASLDIGWRF